MHLRRSLALTAGALVLLTSCGFDLATDRPYTPGEGTNDNTGDVDVLSALVVAKQPNQGTVVVTLVNGTDDEQALSGIAGDDLEVVEFEAIAVPPRAYVNLADAGGVPISGDFDAGDFIPVRFTFASGDTATLDVPVVTACGPYLDLDLTEGSENIPYDCEFEPEPVGGEE